MFLLANGGRPWREGEVENLGGGELMEVGGRRKRNLKFWKIGKACGGG